MINNKKIEVLQKSMDSAQTDAKVALNKVYLLQSYREELAEKLNHCEKELKEAEQNYFEKNCVFASSIQNLKEALIEEVDKKSKT